MFFALVTGLLALSASRGKKKKMYFPILLRVNLFIFATVLEQALEPGVTSKIFLKTSSSVN